MKILNLFAGIGGNRTAWGDEHDITAVEIDPDIANIYQERFPQDTVIVEDALEYIVEHFNEYDFIWASPPCQSHIMFRMIYGKNIPDMTSLYGLITFLQYNQGFQWIVENVRPWYSVLLQPNVKLGRHYYWSNFHIPNKTFNQFRNKTINYTSNTELREFHQISIKIKKNEQLLLRNCVDFRIGKYILDCVIKPKQKTLW